MIAPRAFISYADDSTEHKAWTLKLATDLRAKGIDVVLDQWDLVAGQDVSLFMQKGIAEADRVLMICSANYVQKAEAGVGGVGYERPIVTQRKQAFFRNRIGRRHCRRESGASFPHWAPIDQGHPTNSLCSALCL